MSTLILYTEGGELKQLELDVTERAVHETSSNVTDRAVETGAAITDHIRSNQATLTLEGWISNTPIRENVTTGGRVGALGSTGASTLQFATPFDRVHDTDELLERLRVEGTLVDVVTTFRTYQQMLIRRYQITKDATTASVLPLAIDFVQPRLVSSQTVLLPEPAQRRGRGRNNRGQQAGSDATGRQSTLVQVGIRRVGLSRNPTRLFR